ncbi:MAG: DUF4395 family protein [Dehalococcoidia bacterium]
MTNTLSTNALRRLEMQGWVGLDPAYLAEVHPWTRLAPALCMVVAAVGTALASPLILLALAVTAGAAAASGVHVFELFYNYGLRRINGTRPLPRARAARRFACGAGAIWLAATAALFIAGADLPGYILGSALVATSGAFTLTGFCIPSLIFNKLFGREAACRASLVPQKMTVKGGISG